jgi:hypothetical protein
MMNMSSEEKTTEYKLKNVSEEDKNRATKIEVALKAGCILLSSGAEIWRVEETVHRILEGYGLSGEDIFVLSNGMFFTIEINGNETYAKVRHIPISSTKLYMITEVNDLSRNIGKGNVSPKDALKKLCEIEKMKGKKFSTLVMASFLGSASFSYLFGENIQDTFISGFSGMIVFIIVLLLSSGKRAKTVSKLTLNILGGFIAAICTRLFFMYGFGSNMKIAIIGAIMPLIPGVALVTAVRDLANADYIAGAVRLFDAILITFGIAVGVYVAGVVIR